MAQGQNDRSRGPVILSARQHAVLDLVGKRLTVKEIADQLDISDTRVSQHIRNLKTKFGEETLSGLVAAHRAADERDRDPFSVSEGVKNQLPPWPDITSESSRNKAEHIPLSDSRPYVPHGSWKGTNEPRIVPEALDGPYGQLLRALAMMGILVGSLVALSVSVSTMDTMSRLFAQ